MTFKLYEDKSSVLKKNSRYVQGGDTEVLSNSLGWWEKRTDILTDQSDDITFYITSEFQYRPDKVAYTIYGRHDVEWLILQYNGILDVNTEFVSGKTIKLPSPTRLFTEILSKNIKYQSL